MKGNLKCIHKLQQNCIITGLLSRIATEKWINGNYLFSLFSQGGFVLDKCDPWVFFQERNDSEVN